ncbi:hypothetical protein [Phenylobacterium sp. J367]|uniref:hypothetical protein n=1 Tax=Phenylobacterium sp. J367 TaxID=2898435 RepID=UPI0021518A7C|nr:hypothetical protein [Phenylobacterium sp. J367]MCR5877316.1 hypothetical protein [Phenylobacterium sp. J367]
MGKNLEMSSDVQTGKKPARVNQTLAKHVREVLLMLGGEAHRALVIEQVARTLGHDVRQIPRGAAIGPHPHVRRELAG